MPHRSDWWYGDLVAERDLRDGERFHRVYRFLGDTSLTRWAGLTTEYDLIQGYDPRNPVLLARVHGDRLCPALDLADRTLVAVPEGGAA